MHDENSPVETDADSSATTSKSKSKFADFIARDPDKEIWADLFHDITLTRKIHVDELSDRLRDINPAPQSIETLAECMLEHASLFDFSQPTLLNQAREMRNDLAKLVGSIQKRMGQLDSKYASEHVMAYLAPAYEVVHQLIDVDKDRDGHAIKLVSALAAIDAFPLRTDFSEHARFNRSNATVREIIRGIRAYLITVEARDLTSPRGAPGQYRWEESALRLVNEVFRALGFMDIHRLKAMAQDEYRRDPGATFLSADYADPLPDDGSGA